MNTTTAARFMTAATAAVVLMLPGVAASAQDCVGEAPGTSSNGTPSPCETEPTEVPTVRGVNLERPDQGAPDPEAAPALAATGASSAELAIAAAAAVGAGGALVLSTRRRRVEA